MGSKSRNIIKRIKSRKMYQMWGYTAILTEAQMLLLAEWYKQQGRPINIEDHLIN